ncbi:MAG TPA: hypothetical protein VGF88_12050 [Acidobacteriaceae bacterium]
MQWEAEVPSADKQPVGLRDGQRIVDFVADRGIAHRASHVLSDVESRRREWKGEFAGRRPGQPHA